MSISYAVFTKPWKTQSLEEVAEIIGGMGFNAVEYPLRGGYQAERPKDIENLCKVLGKSGIQVASMAAGIDVAVEKGHGEPVGATEELYAACGAAGVPVIRICQGLDSKLGFWENIEKLKAKYAVAEKLGEKYGVCLGVQMHYDHGTSGSVTASYDSYILLKDFDPRYVAAVWDAGHSGLAGEPPERALDCLWDHLCMVNFKAAYWKRGNGPEATRANWGVHWTTGQNGMCPWDRAVAYLKQRGYEGTVCLPAEYSDEPAVEAYTRQDIAYIQALFAK
ncbi:MAG: sugar phosphate isomerase/epimerase [Oscillospiraceae bacterium]|jgi:sugar phosphate isomerase/epimerase|nr:sugar phosphate isomerase/epimerase [Oscillospiraceae bacterium]